VWYLDPIRGEIAPWVAEESPTSSRDEIGEDDAD
jgi:hypothetical protein